MVRQGRRHRPSVTVRIAPCLVTLLQKSAFWAISLWPSASLVTAFLTTSQTLPSPPHFPSPFSLESVYIQQSIKQSCWSPSLSITHCLSRLDGCPWLTRETYIPTLHICTSTICRYTVKKRLAVFLSPARESLVNDIQAWDGKLLTFFLRWSNKFIKMNSLAGNN